MPTVSVKLPDATKARIDRLAATKGTSPHALMVEAIEAELDRQEKHGAFVEAALLSLDETLASGKAYAGEEVIAYLKAKSRGEKSANRS
ncbi:MAG TPA: ribbon-helix-helix domain-containing protein [Burkholderiaceae bacterium]|nr:ribbon-helix-helix domain-containing protein [Burkholderiaceae bacterium]